MKKYKLEKGSTFIEFYYTGLMIETSWELEEYIKVNQWYYTKMREDIKEQFREKYKRLKAMEEKKQC